MARISGDLEDNSEEKFGWRIGQKVKIREQGIFNGMSGVISGFGRGGQSDIVHVSLPGPANDWHNWPFKMADLLLSD